jgi:protein O-GlcNAc transferase
MAPLTIQQVFELALQQHQAGRLQDAEKLYRQVLAQQPDFIDAIHNLGVIANQTGHHDIALDLIRRVLVLKPKFAEAHSNLGIALKNSGQLDEAIAAHRRAIELMPNYAQAHNNLGNALREHQQLGEAITAYRRAIELMPNYAQAHNNLGNALRDNRQLDEAIAAYLHVIALRPGYAEAHYNLGNTLGDKGQLDEAIAAYLQAIALNPKLSDAHNNLAIALKDKGRTDEAIAAFRRAIALNPNLPDAHNNLSIVLKDSGQLDEAIIACLQAIALRPNFPEAHDNLGSALSDIGQLDKSLAAHRQAVVLRPDYAKAHSNLLLTLQYHPSCAAQTIFEEHLRWNRQHADPLKHLIQTHKNDRNPDRRLRIGYVSPDFRDHVVCHYVLPLLAKHDHGQFEIYCYAQVPVPDDMTRRVQQHADAWRSIVGLSDSAVAQMIRDDQIDILIDLSGHTAGYRLLVFAQKPAPVQVTYLGYPATTGLETIDYRLTDALADPPSLTDSLCSEQLIRLPKCAWCYQAPQQTPAVNALPALQSHHITFGSFNNFTKMNESILKWWAKILHQVPQSRLLFKSKALVSESAREKARQFMRESGIRPDRLDLRVWAPASKHLALYNQIDIALDTYPYHGTTTTCESLWMGVPVVTLAGQTHVSRVGVSLLQNVGLAEMIGSTPEQYVQIAVDLTNNLPRLAELRSTLRQQMERSPLMDAPKFARNIEAAYRQMWHTWCQANSAKT